MIFRTINADAKGLNYQLGVLGKSFKDIRKDLQNGQGVGFSIFGGGNLNTNDWQSLKNFDNALKSIDETMPHNVQVSAAYTQVEA